DLVAAARDAGVEPVELLVAGENVEPELLAGVSDLPHPPRVVAVYRRADLPSNRLLLSVALWRLADPGQGRAGRASGRGGLRRPDLGGGVARVGGRDLARAGGRLGRRAGEASGPRRARGPSSRRSLARRAADLRRRRRT